jgi:hypothetical protein
VIRVDRETCAGECDGNAKCLARKISVLRRQDLDSDGGVDVFNVHDTVINAGGERRKNQKNN